MGIRGQSLINRVTEIDYIRIYIKLLAVVVLSVLIVLAPQEQKQELPIPVQKPVSAATATPKVEAPVIDEAPAAAPIPVAKPAPVAQPASSGNSIEEIVRQAARDKGIDEDYFVRIAKCESGLNPNAVNRNYYENGNPSGLFQHISGYWPNRAAKYGYAGASVFDAVANANVTAGMFADGLTYLWECK